MMKYLEFLTSQMSFSYLFALPGRKGPDKQRDGLFYSK